MKPLEDKLGEKTKQIDGFGEENDKLMVALIHCDQSSNHDRLPPIDSRSFSSVVVVVVVLVCTYLLK